MKTWGATPILRRRYHAERRGLPPIAWIVGLVLMVGFVEVWESTRVSALTLDIDRAARELARTEARRDYLDAELAAARTRPALAQAAKSLGMKPADPAQIVLVPDAYLAGTDNAVRADRGLAALGRRAFEVLVPQARARTR